MIRNTFGLEFLNRFWLIPGKLNRLSICQPFSMECIGASLFVLLGTLLFSLPAFAEDGYSFAEQLVKTQPCTADQSVDQYLNQKISHIHRDLGWRVFSVDNGFWVERVFMVSKGAELRYRWHVPNNSTTPSPVNERAQNLCS